MNQPFTMRHKDAVVGIFVLTAAAILLTIVVVLLLRKEIFEERYCLNTRFEMGIGLNAGAPVGLSGVVIGTVEDVRLNDLGGVDLRMRLKKSFQNRIRENSLATIRRPNAVGDKMINLSQGTPDSKVIADGGWVRSQEAAEIDDALAHLTRISRDLETIVGRIERGEGTVGALLKDRSTLDSINGLVAAGSRILRDGDRFVGNLNSISKTADSAMQQLPLIAGQVSGAVGAVQGLAVRADTLVRELTKLSAQMPAVIEDGNDLLDQAGDIAHSVKSNWLVQRNLPPSPDSLLQFEARQ